MDPTVIIDNSSDTEQKRRKDLLGYFQNCPIPDNEVLANLGLFLSKPTFARMLYLHDLYKMNLDVHGIVVEFGVRWGQNLALFETFRGLYEPYNKNRKIVGFDTFEGFPIIDPKDGDSEFAVKGAYGVSEKYEKYLEQLLEIHEQESPNSHIQGFEIIKGDASLEIYNYLNDHPETIISLAYFDLDLYEPTKACLQAIKSHLTKGSIIAFDELNLEEFPGETIALKEVFGLDKYKLNHTRYSSNNSYLIVE